MQQVHELQHEQQQQQQEVHYIMYSTITENYLLSFHFHLVGVYLQQHTVDLLPQVVVVQVLDTMHEVVIVVVQVVDLEEMVEIFSYLQIFSYEVEL